MANNSPKDGEDFLKMQQEAINRVREMQRRAKSTLENAGLNLGDAAAPHTGRRHDEGFYSGPDIGREDRPPEPPEPHGPPPQKKAPPAEGPDFIKNAVSSIFGGHGGFNLSLDSEQIIILLLMYIIYKDGGDRKLILALAYVMMG